MAIIRSEHGTTTITGEDIDTFRSMSVAGMCKLYAKAKITPTRTVNATRLLEMAGEITGKKYRRGQHMTAYEDIMAMVRKVREGQNAPSTGSVQ